MTLVDFDVACCTTLNRLNSLPRYGRVFAVASRLGDGVFWYALWLAIAGLDGWPGVQAACVMALSGAACTAIYKTLKHCTARERPCATRPGLHLSVAPLDRFSFPSGHTLHAVCFSILGIAYAPALAYVLVPFTILVGLSRMVLGLHYPSDVLAGAGVGTVVALAALPWL